MIIHIPPLDIFPPTIDLTERETGVQYVSLVNVLSI